MKGATLLDDPGFAGLKAAVIARTGHHYYVDKDAQLAGHIADRMAAAGVADLGAYRMLLERPGGGAEWRRLESAITINETFFFRFPEQFEALRRAILPALLRAHAGDRRLRIWSVGCSTGAEPYSLAILVHDLLGAAIADWSIAILGTDIDEAALAQARSASYGSWTLRTLGEDERARLFDLDAGKYRLKRPYRGMVRFERHNMMHLIDGSNPLQFSDFDLILCRNVLIYFGQDEAAAVVKALIGSLTETGWLLLGHAEASPDFAAAFGSTEVDGILAYRRREAGTTPIAALPAFAPAAPVRTAPPVRPRRAVPPARRRIAPAPPPAPAPEPAPVESASARADDPVPHYLAALGAVALGDAERAEQGFRSALYLEPGFVMAHYLLGRHLVAKGDRRAGRRSLANAARLAAARPFDEELPEGDGMTAGRLTLAVRHALGDAA